MTNPKITVVTVCMNAADTIEQTILSVINQTYDNIEYIVIDGASTDGTTGIIKQYEQKICQWISEPDKGIYDAMNKGLMLANGDYLIFLGADDVFYNKDVIHNVASHIDSENIVYYGNVQFKNTETIHWGKFNKLKWASSNICHQAIFYPKKVYKRFYYDTSYSVYADYIYNLNLLQQTIKFQFVNEIITLFNTTGYSSYSFDKKFTENFAQIAIKTLGFFPYVGGELIKNIVFPLFEFINMIKKKSIFKDKKNKKQD